MARMTIARSSIMNAETILASAQVPSLPGVTAYSDGTIKLPDSEAMMPCGVMRSYKTKRVTGCVTRSSKSAKHKYYGLYSLKFGNLKVHQVVCEAFHGPKPSANSVVIHLDEDGLNNRPENLRWGTQKENLNMPKFISYCQGRTGENSPTIKFRRANESQAVFA